MTLPAFSAAGVGSTGNPSWPTHTTGDFALLLIEWDGANNPTTPSGWILAPGFPIAQPSTKFAAYYRFATSGSEGAPTIAITAEDHHWATIVTYTGVNSINPFHVVSTTSSASIALKTFPGYTTFLADCLIVNVLAWGLDSAGPLFSGEVNGDLGSLAERYDAGTIAASGGGLYVNDGTKAARGDFTYSQVTPSSNTISNGATLALQAADQSFGTKSQIINNKRRTMFVKQSTAQDWRFAMFDSADGVTGKTGLTLAVTIQKQGDTSFASISPTVTEIGSGHYNAALTTTHMNTVGNVSLRATATGAIPADCPNCIDVIGFDKTDAAALGLSRIDAAITSRLAPTVAARTLDVSSTGEAGLDFDNIKDATGAHTLTNIRVPNVTLTDTVTTYTGNTVQTGDSFARLGAPAGASHAADVAAVKAVLPAALTAAGNIKADALRVNGSSTGAANLALQFDGTGLTGGTFPAPQSQVTTLSSDAAAGLVALQADTDDIQTRLPAALTGAGNMKADSLAISGDTAAADNLEATFDGTGYANGNAPATQTAAATIAGYIDTEITSIIATLATLSTAASLAAAKAVVDAIKLKTDQLTFTIANQVDANALTGGGGATASDVIDELEGRVYESGLGTPESPDRTYKGFFRRLGGLIEQATGLKGSTVQVLAPDGTVLMTIPQAAQGASHAVSDISGSEA